jgi:orotate phosphoribosyltransferase
VVDDVGSDGEMLCEAVDNLRRAGVYVDQVWVLVDRMEGDVTLQLAAVSTQYRYVCSLTMSY